MPLLALFGSEELSLASRLAVSGVVVVFAVGTTALLHTITKPYVLRIVAQQPGTKGAPPSFYLETLNIFLRRSEVPFTVKEVGPPEKGIFSTFRLLPVDRNFYVHLDDASLFRPQFRPLRQLFQRCEDKQ